MPPTSKVASTQIFLPISRIEQDVVILRDGSLRSILHAYPINFDLKSEVEQNAIIYGYQTFLNSLQFPIQVVIRSKRLELERYLVKLEAQIKNIQSSLLQIQTQDYIAFLRRLIQIANIMSKQFFVIVGFENISTSKGGLLNFLPGKKEVSYTEEQFKACRDELINRTNLVTAGLNSVGIRTEMLRTQQIIELFYNIYNPEESTTERLAPVEELKADVIESGKSVNQTETAPNNQTGATSQVTNTNTE